MTQRMTALPTSSRSSSSFNASSPPVSVFQSFPELAERERERMKYMRLGTKPDSFHTVDGVRQVKSDEPGDLLLEVNNTKYLLHKFSLMAKCGLLESAGSGETLKVPGGKEGFEMCARFAYDIAITVGASNVVGVLYAARFLKMKDLELKLESFFEGCILRGWKDCLVSLRSTLKFVDYEETPAIVDRCVRALVRKILVHPSKVSWSYTYTRPGFSMADARSAPRDWWTEDIAALELNHFSAIIFTIKTHKEIIPSSLIGESLHVYASKHLLSPPTSEGMLPRCRRFLEALVPMIPPDPRSVSVGFVLKLLGLAAALDSPPRIIAELVRRSSCCFHEAAASDLLFFSSENPKTYNVKLVEVLLENFIRQIPPPPTELLLQVGKTIDSYLKIIGGSANTSVMEFTRVAAALPECTRLVHDDLYFAVDTFLKDHQTLSKEEKKQLCQIIDCRKLSSEVRSHAVTNDRLPMRTVVQLLFLQQERDTSFRHLSPSSVTAADDEHEGNKVSTTDSSTI